MPRMNLIKRAVCMRAIGDLEGLSAWPAALVMIGGLTEPDAFNVICEPFTYTRPYMGIWYSRKELILLVQTIAARHCLRYKAIHLFVLSFSSGCFSTYYMVFIQ